MAWSLPFYRWVNRLREVRLLVPSATLNGWAFRSHRWWYHIPKHPTMLPLRPPDIQCFLTSLWITDFWSCARSYYFVITGNDQWYISWAKSCFRGLPCTTDSFNPSNNPKGYFHYPYLTDETREPQRCRITCVNSCKLVQPGFKLSEFDSKV